LNILTVLLQVLANEEDNSKASHNLRDKWEVMELNSNTRANLKARSEVVGLNFNVKANPKANLVKDHFSLMDTKDQQLFM